MTETRIKIESHETKELSFGVKHIVTSGKTKYEFFETKKDGSQTKAFEQWKKFGLKTGSEVDIAFNEEQKPFPGKDGKQINYTQRTILYFKGDEFGTPYQYDSPKQPITATQPATRSIEERVSALERRFLEIERARKEGGSMLDRIIPDEIDEKDIPF